MVGSLSPSEQEQLLQTIEMFEVITQSQPHDYQSLEILKEAYLKLSREDEAVQTSRRIAEAYVQLGHLSSAMLEYETILQRVPDDREVRRAIQEIEAKASKFGGADDGEVEAVAVEEPVSPEKPRGLDLDGEVDDGESMMRRLFVDGKQMNANEFDLCWHKNAVSDPGAEIIQPFLHHLEEKKIMAAEKAFKLLSEKARAAYLPIGLYDVDIEFARKHSAETCRRWCVLPFDRMSKTTLVATCNPFNKRAAQELQLTTPGRILWYIASPSELVREIKKVYR